MFYYIIADLVLFSINLASIVGLLLDTFLHKNLLELPVYGLLLLLNIDLIALKTQLISDKDGKLYRSLVIR